ncbi:MAG TPA: hydrogenase maturation nickel metallochaperone HypA [Dehalococcoidales bacterium]
MHELAITQSMFDIVLKQAEQVKAKKVTKINLVIGEMTGVVSDCIQFYMDFLSKGTVAEGVVVSVNSVPPTAKCLSCGKTFKVKELEWKCPHCDGINLEVTGGKELFVESIEVD